MNNLVFCDVETTGLEPGLHEVWEIAYAVNDGPVVSYRVPHSLVTADPKALALNGYFSRISGSPDYGRIDLSIREMLDGNTLVGANPGFDTEFLRARWSVTPWKYRKIDVESMALLLFQWERPRGLADIAEELRGRGHDISAPDHSAAKDVEVTREVYRALRGEQNWLINKT